MRHGSLFSGIGGFDLAAEWMGWTNVFHTEWNEFGQKVLKHHFPNSIQYHDIIKTDYSIHRNDIDIITGGFPCQPFSLAGKRKGKDDERYLWHEMLRAIQQIQPTYVVAENVRGLLTIDGGMVFEQVFADLEAEGYEVQPVLLPAAGVNAPHRRDRIFIVAYSNKCDDRRTSRADETASRKERLSERHQVWQSSKPSEVQQPAANSSVTRLEGSTRTGEAWKHGPACKSESDESTEPAANTDLRRLERSEAEGWNSEHVEWTGSIGPAANTNKFTMRHKPDCRSNTEAAEGKGEKARNVDGTRDTEPIANTNNNGNSSQGQSSEVERDRRRNNGIKEQRQQSSERTNGLHGLQRNAANTNDKRLERFSRTKRELERSKRSALCDSYANEPNTWQNFPTESAICGGNDGLPDRLDDITFPKWRNESIKAYGNAVVPQLILPIFQTIEKLHREKNT